MPFDVIFKFLLQQTTKCRHISKKTFSRCWANAGRTIDGLLWDRVAPAAAGTWIRTVQALGTRCCLVASVGPSIRQIALLRTVCVSLHISFT